jgi:hypothetical protein
MLDEQEFLSSYGIRAISRHHRQHPYTLPVNGYEHRVDYEPGESTTGFFGGNSNWRGPIWFPVNYLLIESLQKFHHYLGPSFRVECPTESGRMMTLAEVAAELSRRLSRIFLRDEDGPPAGVRRHPTLPARSTLARLPAVPRILSWRQRSRRRREPPDRMDRPSREAPPTEWRVAINRSSSVALSGCQEAPDRRAWGTSRECPSHWAAAGS